MAQESPSSLFRRLTKLFRSGPVIKRRVQNFDSGTDKTSTAFDAFRKNQSQVYSAAMSAYGAYDRMARYSDFSEMEYTPEIARFYTYILKIQILSNYLKRCSMIHLT